MWESCVELAELSEHCILVLQAGSVLHLLSEHCILVLQPGSALHLLLFPCLNCFWFLTLFSMLLLVTSYRFQPSSLLALWHLLPLTLTIASSVSPLHVAPTLIFLKDCFMFSAPSQIHHRHLDWKSSMVFDCLKGLSALACYLQIFGLLLSNRNRKQATDVDHIYNLKFSSSHIKK